MPSYNTLIYLSYIF